MFGIGFEHLVVIMFVALLLLGPKKLPDVARALGRGYAEFKKTMDELKGAVNRDDTVSGLRAEFRAAQQDVNIKRHMAQRLLLDEKSAAKAAVFGQSTVEIETPAAETGPEEAAKA